MISTECDHKGNLLVGEMLCDNCGRVLYTYTSEENEPPEDRDSFFAAPIKSRVIIEGNITNEILRQLHLAVAFTFDGKTYGYRFDTSKNYMMLDFCSETCAYQWFDEHIEYGLLFYGSFSRQIGFVKDKPERFRTEIAPNLQKFTVPLVNKGKLTAKQLLDLGVERKHQQNFQGAKEAYLEAKEIDPRNVMVYYSLGKLCYMMKNRSEAIVNYLIAAHLGVQNVALAIQQNTPAAQAMKMQLKQLSPDIVIFQSIHPFVPFVFLDSNTPRHLAHALIDLDDSIQVLPEIYAHIRHYERGMFGQENPMNSDGFYELDMNMYRLVGVWFIVDNLRWDSVEVDRPDMVYNSSQNYVYKSFELFDGFADSHKRIDK